MRWYLHGAAVGAAGLILGLAVLGGRAADGKDLKAAIQKVAAAYDKNDEAGAKKLAAEVAKDTKDFEDVMHLLALRTKKGLGVGPKPGAITPDGIEKMVEELSGKEIAKGKLEADSAGLAQMGNEIAAIAEVSLAKKPAKDEGKKKVADWVKWSNDMRGAGLALAAAAKKKDPAALKKAADKANTSCSKCHDVFRFE